MRASVRVFSLGFLLLSSVLGVQAQAEGGPRNKNLNSRSELGSEQGARRVTLYDLQPAAYQGLLDPDQEPGIVGVPVLVNEQGANRELQLSLGMQRSGNKSAPGFELMLRW